MDDRAADLALLSVAMPKPATTDTIAAGSSVAVFFIGGHFLYICRDASLPPCRESAGACELSPQCTGRAWHLSPSGQPHHASSIRHVRAKCALTSANGGSLPEHMVQAHGCGMTLERATYDASSPRPCA